MPPNLEASPASAISSSVWRKEPGRIAAMWRRRQRRHAWHRVPGTHLLKLRGRGLDFVVSEDHAPHLRCADVGPQVDAHALFLQSHKILPQGAPVRSDLVVLIAHVVGLMMASLSGAAEPPSPVNSVVMP